MKSMIRKVGVLLCLLFVAGACVAQSPTMSRQGDIPDANAPLLPYEKNTVDIVKRYKDSVVAINVTVRGIPVNPLQQLPPDARQFFQQFGFNQPAEPQHETERAAGSGFVVDPQGQILTNYHVVSNALKGNSTRLQSDATITVQFPGGQPLPVKVVGVDQSYDLALLQLKDRQALPTNAKPIPLANSSHVQVGEKAIAIGNPYLLQSSVTQGIVSATNREQDALVSGVPIPYIQTDAAINPGNSGGPLIDSRGRVIGVNDEILAPHGSFVGVGFAIPSNLIQETLPRMQAGGFIKKAMIGITVEALADFPKVVRQELNLPDHGLMVVKVLPHSPGARAGLTGAQFTVNADGTQWPAGGDVILSANGHKLTHALALQKIVLGEPADSTVTLVVLHDGRKRTVVVRLAVLKPATEQEA